MVQGKLKYQFSNNSNGGGSTLRGSTLRATT